MLAWRRCLNHSVRLLCAAGRNSASEKRVIDARIATLTKFKPSLLPVQWMLLFGLIKTSSPDEQTLSKEDKIQLAKCQATIREADSLFDENKYVDAYKLLAPLKDSNDVEILWRITRALYNMSKQTVNKEQKKQFIFESYETIQKALALNDNHYAVHKWYAILLDVRMSYDGIRARINHLITIKDHMLKAVDLNPDDATTWYMLGYWCFSIAELPWYQRQIASAIFGSPPISSYEEALEYFHKAEEIDPYFYSKNLLMLGETYLRLSDIEKAKYYLEKAAAYPSHTEDDIQANKEAAELLKKIKV